MKKKIFYFISLICLIIAYSINLYSDQFGDKQLKRQKKQLKNYYLGISESKNSFDEAYNNALQNAQNMIALDLGITINSTTTTRSIALETNEKIDLSFYVQRDIQFESEHDIKARVSRIYYETNKNKNDLIYKAWVELFFNSEAFYQKYNDFWIYELTDIGSQKNIKNYERLLELKNRFIKEEKYLNNQIVREYSELNKQYQTYLNGLDILITAQNNHKFSNNFVFTFYDRKNNQLLQNLPVKINTQPYQTNNEGNINYIADYKENIVILLGNNLDKYLDQKNILLYENDSFSPLKNKNVTLAVNSFDPLIKNTLTQLFKDIGFQINQMADIQIDIKANSTIKRISINEYITDLRYEIKINNIIQYIPSDPKLFIKGYGKTENDANISAYSMEWLNSKNAEIDRLVKVIHDFLLK